MVTSADVLKIAAFSDGNSGGNPAGVVIGDHLPRPEVMQAIATEIGFSETAFAAIGDREDNWVVRYYSPEVEVPFCGHATIALGAALVLQFGDGLFQLSLSGADISVEGVREGDVISATLQSPSTSSQKADDAVVATALELFGYGADDLDGRIPPAIANAGGHFLVLALK
ncbi:MAG: PhzF family phenazine biosynthesis protein, partial [Alphaproteobacteria bacterium]|nr:PhzF family phenazine biosynthesis protein [Alphaproteobacteria bacterium]